MPGAEPENKDEAIARYQAAILRAVRWMRPADASAEVLSLTAEAAEAFAAKLEARPPGGGLWGYVTGAGNVESRGVFVIGLIEPGANGATATQDGDAIEAIIVAPPAFEGPDGHLHGGQIASIFDEICAIAQSLGGVSGRTASLNVTYHQPAPLLQPLTLRAAVSSVDGRKITVSATLHHGETLCSSAEALFIQQPPG